MIIGHIPAGYIITTAILRRQALLKEEEYGFLLWIGIGASILPDLDLLYFYLIDNRQHLHHSYWTHIPVYWVVVFIPLYLYTTLLKRQRLQLTLITIFTNITGHLLLDTITGKIRWLYPLLNTDFVIFHVPAQYNWWVLNFVYHWTFAFELGLIIWALCRWGASGQAETAAQE